MWHKVGLFTGLAAVWLAAPIQDTAAQPGTGKPGGVYGFPGWDSRSGGYDRRRYEDTKEALPQPREYGGRQGGYFGKQNAPEVSPRDAKKGPPEGRGPREGKGRGPSEGRGPEAKGPPEGKGAPDFRKGPPGGFGPRWGGGPPAFGKDGDKKGPPAKEEAKKPMPPSKSPPAWSKGGHGKSDWRAGEPNKKGPAFGKGPFEGKSPKGHAFGRMGDRHGHAFGHDMGHRGHAFAHHGGHGMSHGHRGHAFAHHGGHGMSHGHRGHAFAHHGGHGMSHGHRGHAFAHHGGHGVSHGHRGHAFAHHGGHGSCGTSWRSCWLPRRQFPSRAWRGLRGALSLDARPRPATAWRAGPRSSAGSLWAAVSLGPRKFVRLRPRRSSARRL